MKLPFTQDELGKEVNDKTLFGIISGLVALPYMTCKSEDAIDFGALNNGEIQTQLEIYWESKLEVMYNNPIFKGRFFAIIDELVEKRIIDKNCNPTEVLNVPSNSHQLLTQKVLETALKNDLGAQWKLKDYVIKDFTKRGDNYASVVTSISCTATCNENEKKTYYVAKLNPLRQMTIMDQAMNDLFIRESTFFTDIAIKLNDILHSLNKSKVNFPNCIYYNLGLRQEIILSKDLRQQGYKMFDRKVGMDVQHSELLIKEMSKMHAASYIFQSQEGKSLLDIYPFLKDAWLEPNSSSREVYELFIKSGIGISLKLLEHVEGYEKQQNWLRDLDEVESIYIDLIKQSPEKMKVICHGDCWNNNVLFR